MKGETTQKHIKVTKIAMLHKVKIFTGFPAKPLGKG
jgi:hypothetical protein